VLIGEVHHDHDSRARDGKCSSFYQDCALRDGPHDGVRGALAVRRTVPKVEKVDTK